MSDAAYTLKDTDCDESFIHRADMDTPDYDNAYINEWGEEAIAQLNAMQTFISKLSSAGIGTLDIPKLKYLARASVIDDPDGKDKLAARDFKIFLQLAKYGQIYSQINTKYRAAIWPSQKLEKQFKRLKHTLDTNGVGKILIDAYNVYTDILSILSKKRVDVRGTNSKKDDLNIDTNNTHHMIAQDTSDYDSYDSFANKVAMPDKNKSQEVSPERLAELLITYGRLYQAAVVGSQTAVTEQERARYSNLVSSCEDKYYRINSITDSLLSDPTLNVRFLKSYLAQNPTWETPEAIRRAREYIASVEGNK